MESCNCIKFNVVKKFWLDASIDSYTKDRSSAMIKLGDWYVKLDEREAKRAMEREAYQEYGADEYDDEYAGNLFEKPKHIYYIIFILL